MSLLSNGAEIVTVYPEETVTDEDGNELTRAGSVGVVVKASVQPLGPGAERHEKADTGYDVTSRYRLRLAGGFPTGAGILGAQSQVEWRGRRYSIDGEAQLHTGSRRTAHVTYTMVRT
ncbi:phage head completion protein [Mycolicibacterium neoaurum]|uniref:phage head completion protein n=1 Tax=Mycolicibacterium neoaurum TaxID=1795 RepID=UPI001F4C9B36|nr:hypothetical protein [Mycolicibacterium neoaurum]